MLSTPLIQHVTLCLGDKLNQQVILQDIKQVFGGEINQTFVIETNAGKFFLKMNDSATPDMFEKEKEGLLLLGGTNALDVPLPLTAGQHGQTSFLLMGWIEKSSPTKNFWQQFGYGLASLHRQTNPFFGLAEDNYIGNIPQQNTATTNWADFYAECRMMPLMHKALQQQKCSVADVEAAERLCGRFAEVFPPEQPALLHGDLWGGNFMPGGKGQPVIYDPAVYYGHREMDIAMTMLFGGFDKLLYQYYNEAYPLQQGWQQRVPLCQLYPLLVHLVLFGGHYYYNVMEIIKKYC